MWQIRAPRRGRRLEGGLVPHSDEGGDSLAGLRVLVVVALVAGLDEALSVAAREPLDAAVLDVNLAGREVYPAADRLAARGVPFVFATGYGPQGIRDGYRDRPALQKPFEPQELARALTRAVREAAAASARRPQAV
jgi:CheY-like chemotaxis protein